MLHEDVAIIILNYVTWEDTLAEAQLVHDLFDLAWNQIIIVDNHSPNESHEKLKDKTIGDYVYIPSSTNGGYASGNNIGLRYAFENGFRYSWILNNDIFIEDTNILGEMVHILKKDDDLAVVNPDIYATDGHLYNRDSIRPSFYDLTIGFLQYRKKGRAIHDLGGYGYVYRPQGCCMFVDLMKMNAVDYMDEKTFLYCEEFILAERLLKKGWKCGCVNSIKVTHDHSQTVKSVLGKWRMLKIQNSSFDYYLERYRGYSRLKRILCLMFFSIKNLATN